MRIILCGHFLCYLYIDKFSPLIFLVVLNLHVFVFQAFAFKFPDNCKSLFFIKPHILSLTYISNFRKILFNSIYLVVGPKVIHLLPFFIQSMIIIYVVDVTLLKLFHLVIFGFLCLNFMYVIMKLLTISLNS